MDKGTANTLCGTQYFLAPEIIKGAGYGPEVDYWAIGVILYTMYC
jgi:serine/threonine protein kinase